MPTIANFAAAGARAYGHLGKGLVAKVLQTLTFTSNTTWPAPAGVTSIQNMSGYGAPGNPDTTYSTTTYQLREIASAVYDDGASSEVIATTYSAATAESAVPAFYCNAPTTYTINGHFNRRICREYLKISSTSSGGSPATTGASTTAFGNVFPGGYGGPASTTSFSSAAVAPGTGYAIVVPPGGSVTINFFQ